MRRAPCLFCEESFEKMPSFSGTVGPQILSLESVDYFGRSEYLSGPKKKKNLYEQSFDGEANNNKQIAMLIQVSSSQYILILNTSRISGFTFLKSSKIWLC